MPTIEEVARLFNTYLELSETAHPGNPQWRALKNVEDKIRQLVLNGEEALEIYESRTLTDSEVLEYQAYTNLKEQYEELLAGIRTLAGTEKKFEDEGKEYEYVKDSLHEMIPRHQQSERDLTEKIGSNKTLVKKLAEIKALLEGKEGTFVDQLRRTLQKKE